MEPFELYSMRNYKEAILGKVKFLKKYGRRLTFRKLAEKIPVQYTYLSKALNDETTHLNEDHLFRLAQLLEFLPEEIDYLLLLRSASVSQDPYRREYLTKKIEDRAQARTVSAEFQEVSSISLNNEINYLFEPLCIIVHVSLFIQSYRENPRTLCSVLGINTQKLKEILEILEVNQYIALGEDAFEIVEVKKKYPHFGREHPLMRIHQLTLKSAMQARLDETVEQDKESFLISFTMDEEGFEKAKQLFQRFLNEVQNLTYQAKHQHVYQISFDLFKWL